MPARPSRASLIGERPLNPAQRSALVFAAAYTVLVFYIAAIAFMAVLASVLALLFVVALAGARFGLAWLMGRLLDRPWKLLQIFARRLWLPTPMTYRIELQPADAPALFDLTRTIAARSNIRPPSRIYIEMHSNAWVHMKGFWRASGRTELGIGFDLLAGLDVSEVEAVLAHELAHARLVQRGLSRWLNKGLARLANLSGELNAFSAATKATKKPSRVAGLAARTFDSLTRRTARLVATYSRQDEFEADCGAAELCGVDAVRSALTRLHEIDTTAGHLPWSERWARLQPGEKFAEWLVTELAHRDDAPPTDPARHALDPYSTHPSMRDRLAVLATTTTAPTPATRDMRSGVTLLADANAIAERLGAEIQRVVAVQEQKDTRQLAKQTKKVLGPVHMGRVRVLGTAVATIGVFLILFAFDGMVVSEFLTGAMLFVGGIAIYRAGRFRERHALPVPAYGTLTNPLAFESSDAVGVAEAAIVDELRALTSDKRKKREQFDILIDVGYSALKESSYLRAHVACRLALEVKKNAPEAQLGYAVAAAGLGSVSQCQPMLEAIRTVAGLRTVSQQWGAAWAMTLLGDWNCEGFLEQLCKRKPAVATFAACLSYAQFNRGKLQSAIRNAQRAEALEPSNRNIREYLVHLLLTAGRVADAERYLSALDDVARTDAGVAFTHVRTALMRRDVDAARDWASIMRGLDADGGALISLGQAFSMSRLPEPAVEFYMAAVEAKFSPEAHLGLATVATFRGDREDARRHLLAALNFDGAKWTAAQNVNSLFHEVLARFNALDEERLSCRAWIATFPAGDMALSGHSLVVCATSEQSARDHLATIVAALSASTPYDLSAVTWAEAPEEQQPIRPIPPGVQHLVG